MREKPDTKPDLLLVTPVPPGPTRILNDTYTVHRLWEAADKPAFLASIADRIEVAATTTGGLFGEAEMARLPRLKLIANFAVGYEVVDVKAAAARGIVVTNTPGVLTETVADTSMMLVLATVRRLAFQDRYVREKRWLERPAPLTDDVWGQPLGIVGLGRIGLAVARRAEAFRMPVSYHNRTPREDVPYTYHPTLVELARNVRILVVLTPGGPATRKMINREVLDALGPKGYLINMSRGANVDEAAVLAALQEKRIAGAGLDVFENEPKVPEAFFALDNVVLQPHVGSATTATRAAMEKLFLDNVATWFAGAAPLTPVPETPVPAGWRS